MKTSTILPPNDAKQVFKKCGTCSQTFGHLLNRHFNLNDETSERALDPLAGGILNHGHQCGMLWGVTLAVGAEAYRRSGNLDEAVEKAVSASKYIIESFEKSNETVNCKELIGYDLNKLSDLIKYGIRTSIQGMDKNQCFVMAEKWMPEAIASAESGLEAPPKSEKTPKSCASEMVRMLGGDEKEMAMVAGYAGGIGLSGHGCGALSAAIWLKGYEWCKDHRGKNAPLFFNKTAKRLVKKFEDATDGEYRCSKITGRKFTDHDTHSDYIENGGCKEIFEALKAA